MSYDSKTCFQCRKLLGMKSYFNLGGFGFPQVNWCDRFFCKLWRNSGIKFPKISISIKWVPVNKQVPYGKAAE